MLDFAPMCRNVEQLLKFLDQHHVVLRTWWWRNINTSALVSFPLLRYVTVVTSRMHFQRRMQSSGVSYGSAVRVIASYSTYSVLYRLVGRLGLGLRLELPLIQYYTASWVTVQQ